MTMPQELRFDGRVVIVTGAGAGLGRAYALLFASRGASVVVNDLGGGRHGDGNSKKIADGVVDEIKRAGGKAVANYDSVLDGAKIVKTAIDNFGRVDILVNNAGILRDRSFVKMTEEDWDIIQNIHVKGAVNTTKAAWPHFLKQKFGRVIVTSSNSGLYGNFGQANYSSAKLGLVGLANTLAIEGGRKNVHTNVIVPTAASRLTEDILPPDMFEMLKPELIAPVVVWLCHENCMENGSIIESALGWAGKCHLVRSSGGVLRQNLTSGVTPESVQENWAKVTDMSKAKHLDSIQEATGELLTVAELLKTGTVPSAPGTAVLQDSYNFKDSILYALSVGANVQEPSDLQYLYENHEKFAILPSFYVLYGAMGCMTTSILGDVLTHTTIDPVRTLHGEQFLEVHRPLPTNASVETRFKVQDVLDKGKGAVILVEHETFNRENGEKLATGQIGVFAVGAGGFQGPRTSSHTIPTVEPPKRQPDASISQKTSHDQAALYRLNGDLNPLHIDQNIASLAGFPQPILHGLCSLGFAVRHVLQAFAGCDPNAFKALKVRFAKPVLPGQTLRTDMWREGNRIHFRTSIVETDTPVITGAYVDLTNVKVNESPRTEYTPASARESALETDAVFEHMRNYVNENPQRVKAINAIFSYHITVNGQRKATWTLDLRSGQVYKGEVKSGKADATLIIEDGDMMQMALGKLNPQVAFMQGKLKVKGNIMLTQKLRTLMQAAKPKL